MAEGLLRDIRWIVLQYLREEGHTEACHRFEQSSRVFFDVDHLRDLIRRGQWRQAETYFKAFVQMAPPRQHRRTILILWTMARQKFLEALHRGCADGNRSEALTFLQELRMFVGGNGLRENDYARICRLLTIGSFEEDSHLRGYREDASRETVVRVIEGHLKEHPELQGKLVFPVVSTDHLLLYHVNYSLNLLNLVTETTHDTPRSLLTIPDLIECHPYHVSPAPGDKQTDVREGLKRSLSPGTESPAPKRPLVESVPASVSDSAPTDPAIPHNHSHDLQHTTAVTCVAFHPRAKSALLTGTQDGSVYLWSARKTKEKTILRPAVAPVSHVCVDFQLFAVAIDRTVYIFPYQGENISVNCKIEERGPVTAMLMWSNGPRHYLAVGVECILVVRDISNYQEITANKYPRLSHPICSMCLWRDTLCVVTKDGAMHSLVIGQDHRKPLVQRPCPDLRLCNVRAFQFSDGEPRLFASARMPDGSSVVAEIVPVADESALRILCLHKGLDGNEKGDYPLPLDVSSQGCIVAGAGLYYEVWAEGSEEPMYIRRVSHPVRHLRFSEDGHFLVIADESNRVSVFTNDL